MMRFYVTGRHDDNQPVTSWTISPGKSAQFMLSGVPSGAGLALDSSDPQRLTMTLNAKHDRPDPQSAFWERGAAGIPVDGLENAGHGQYLVTLSAKRTVAVATAPVVMIARAILTGQPDEQATMWVTTDPGLAASLQRLVHQQLDIDLPKSVKEEREYGGVFYRNMRSGVIRQTGPFQGLRGENSVDIGTDKENLGCPSGTVPVAWYHTHPFDEVGGLHFEAKAFIDHDKTISDDNDIPGFLGVFDGSFWRYDPAPGADQVWIDPTTDKVLPHEGRFIPLPERLRTKV
jgi:hypothetical protein